MEVCPAARTRQIETVLSATQLERIFYSREDWLCIKYSAQWQPLKTIPVSIRPATHYGLLNWDCLCHSSMSLSHSHGKTSYLLHSQNINIIVNSSQHVSFEHWPNGFWDMDYLRSVHCFLLSNLSIGSNTLKHRIGIINISRKEKVLQIQCLKERRLKVM